MSEGSGPGRANGAHPPAVHPALLAQFGPQFAACIALYEFVAEHRPTKPPTPDSAGRLILWGYARSSKTYQASFRLAATGYGGQAGMLNRSLYEDMAIAHWVRLYPDEARARYGESQRLTFGLWGERLVNHDAPLDLSGYPNLTDEERKTLGRDFRGKT